MERLISQGSQGITIIPFTKVLEKETTSATNKTDTKNLSKDFLSILFEQIKTAAKKSTTQENLLHLNTTTTKASNSHTSLKKPSKPSNELLLGEILNIISLMKENDTKASFPKFTDTMQSLLKKNNITDTNTLLKELKSIKNLSELIDLSKKYTLGLENIKITHQKVETLQKDFPKLDLKQFFAFTEKNNQNHHILTQNNELKISPNVIIKSTAKVSHQIVDTAVQKIQNSALAQNLQTSSPKAYVSTVQQESPKGTQEAPKNILQTLLNHREEKSQKIKIQEKQIEPKLKTKAETPSKIPTKEHDIKIASLDLKKTTQMTKESKEVITKTPITALNLKDYEQHIISQDLKKENQTFEQTKEITTKASMHDFKIKQDNTKATPLMQQSTVSSAQEDTSATTLEHKIETSTSEKLDHVKLDIKNHIPQDMTKADKAIPLKESFNQFASDLKEKMVHYKPPIMKLQLSLNPKNLGSVDVTLLHRGDNLHVNITSNTNTMALFTQNQAEFKNALVNMGFTNLEMNFSNQNQSKNEQQKQGNKQRSTGSLASVQNQTNYDSTLELIVPQYV